jgi:ribosomal protein L32
MNKFNLEGNRIASFDNCFSHRRSHNACSQHRFAAQCQACTSCSVAHVLTYKCIYNVIFSVINICGNENI